MKVVKTCNDNNENLVLTNYNDSKDLDKLVCLGLIKMSCYNQEESANLIVRNWRTDWEKNAELQWVEMKKVKIYGYWILHCNHEKLNKNRLQSN